MSQQLQISVHDAITAALATGVDGSVPSLNWRRDPGYEQRRMLHEQRMEQLRSDSEQIQKETEQIKKETDQIRSETEQLKLENAGLKPLNANGRALLNSIDRLCLAGDSSSAPTPRNRERWRLFLEQMAQRLEPQSGG